MDAMGEYFENFGAPLTDDSEFRRKTRAAAREYPYRGAESLKDYCWTFPYGLSVLMVGARDRVGGRTYTVESDGHLHEMGGTWVTHHMAYLFKEMTRYKMDQDLTLTHHRGYDNDYYTINVPDNKQEPPPEHLTHEEAGQITARVWTIFINAAGQNCRSICPLPHSQLGNILVSREEVERYDKISSSAIHRRSLDPNGPPSHHRRQHGHVNYMTNIHADVEGSELTSWNGMGYPNLLMFGYGDRVTPSGRAHIVGFGKDERATFVPKNPEKAVDAFQKLHPMEVNRMIFHNWNTDPWSLGGPAWWPPEFMAKYQEELQSRHGLVFFASADWAHGWRAAIDGALEQGSQAALQVGKEIRKMRGVMARI
ncbi:uncharacterized protein ASPGLDRAFT_29654 [Aspergillus glaucus CBS 516.65]|uniref:monoamine oxidase n=1 Tax=Aspergillus glaucus CBS 516.65 TaxID=1160497 RepID=A0A1L9V6P5_ASPGL|nr:hypothetical protein ASPGLDRAFT_29654 [Aspergillus glaucus CBS 516.65]OJJ79604.1 hypothetical protein ASPGLDRAFT_29654 [Aspergillus glaucus CBS 516.65]